MLTAAPKAAPEITPEAAEATRERYSTALTYITMPDSKRNKAMHQFYLTFAQSLRTIFTTETDLAAVCFYPGNPVGQLMFNPRNCQNLNLLQFSGLVVHELLHIVCGHVYMSDMAFRKKHPELFAIAVDLVVNQIVVKDGYSLPTGKGILQDEPDLDVQCVSLDNVEKNFGARPPADENTEFYCLWLLDRARKQEKELGSQSCPSCGGSGGKGQPGGDSGNANEPSDGSKANGQGTPGTPGKKGQQGQPQDSQDSDEAGEDEQTGDQGDAGDGEGQEEDEGPGSKPQGKHDHDPNATKQCDCPDCNGTGELTPEQVMEQRIKDLYDMTGHKGSFMEAIDEMPDADRDLVGRYMAQNVQDAVQQAGGLSSLPGHLQGLVENLLSILETKVHIEHLLSEFYGGCGLLDIYVNRTRFNYHGGIGKLSFTPGAAAGVVADSSGSVSDQEFSYFAGICLKVQRDYDMQTFIQQSSYGETVPIQPLEDALAEAKQLAGSKGAKVKGEGIGRTGYGGTNMRPGCMNYLKEIEEKGEYSVGGIIVLTDGELGHDSIIRPDEIDIPLLYLCSRRYNPFYGTTFAGRIFYFDMNTGIVEDITDIKTR